MSAIEPFIDRWPGKSASAEIGIEHSAAYHMLDVAAVAECLITPFGLSHKLGQAMVLLVALHDLGKVGHTFRAMLRHGVPQGQGRHWEVTEAYLCRFDILLGGKLGSRDSRRKLLYAATAGHHGRPPGSSEFRRMIAAAGAEGIADAEAVLTAFMQLWPDASLEDISMERAKEISWWLPGLVSATDWIGSNQEWFPATPPTMSVRDYLNVARARALLAVQGAGMASPASAGGELFPFALRPMQAACAEIALPDGPMLAVIEDETGAGKTEAALILAQRMMLAGKGRASCGWTSVSERL